MAKTIKLKDFEDTVKAIVGEYFDGIADDASLSVAEVAADTIRILEQTSPKRDGDYSKGWAVTQAKRRKRYIDKVVIHNKDHYQLTHLLEHGHLITRYGKVYGRTQAHPHIEPAERKAAQQLIKKIERSIKNDN